MSTGLEHLGLPRFPYHRDAISSGSIAGSDAVCQCCARSRGAIYVGVIYELVDTLCPWCIADGSAYDKFGATFFDAEFGDADLNPVELPEHFRRAVFGCTVGFSTNNPIIWWVHCGEPAEYVSRIEPYDMVFECRSCGQRQVIADLD